MPADRHDLPALDRLTADVATAMRAAEQARPARWWRRMPPLVIALLALAVPSAVALHATTGKGDDRGVHVPGVRSPDAAVAIARGAVNGHRFTLAAVRCDAGRTVSVALLLAAGASGARCSGAVWGARPVSATSMWQPGETWVYGVARPGVASVDLRVVRREGRRWFGARWLRVVPRPFDPRAVVTGGLPRDLRYVLLYRPRRSELTDAVARDARGHVLYRCALPGVAALSRTDGSPAPATGLRPCA